MIFFSGALMFTGFISLSLAMRRHHAQIKPGQLPLSGLGVLLCRLAGYGCLAVALALCIVAKGTGIGIVWWTGLISVTALLQALLLTYRPEWALRLGSAGVVVSAVVLLLQ